MRFCGVGMGFCLWGWVRGSVSEDASVGSHKLIHIYACCLNTVSQQIVPSPNTHTH